MTKLPILSRFMAAQKFSSPDPQSVKELSAMCMPFHQDLTNPCPPMKHMIV